MTYELRFEFAPMTDEVEDAVCERLDASFVTHSGVTTAAILTEGPSCLAAALSAVDQLNALGAPPLRLVDDLVTRGEIARRARVTPQAVGQWIRGERQATGSPFPRPYVVASTELWLWGEAREALRGRAIVLDVGVDFPDRRDIQVIGGALAAHQRAGEAGWAPHGALHAPTWVTFAAPHGQVAVDSKRTRYALAS